MQHVYCISSANSAVERQDLACESLSEKGRAACLLSCLIRFNANVLHASHSATVGRRAYPVFCRRASPILAYV